MLACGKNVFTLWGDVYKTCGRFCVQVVAVDTNPDSMRKTLGEYTIYPTFTHYFIHMFQKAAADTARYFSMFYTAPITTNRRLKKGF